MKKFKNVLFLSLCGIMFLVFACGSGSEISSNSSDDSSDSKSEKFSYTIDKQYAGDYNIGYYIEGVLTNNTEKDYSYVQVEFICYDKDGNNLGTALANTNNLLGKQTWKYKALFMGSDSKNVDHCDYHETTSW